MRGQAPFELGPHWTRPVVLLVDEGTTSGKELAGVGGRGFLMADGSLLHLAVMDIGVDGRHLEGVGVAPDVVVPFERRWAAGRDPQLGAALAEACKLLE